MFILAWKVQWLNCKAPANHVSVLVSNVAFPQPTAIWLCCQLAGVQNIQYQKQRQSGQPLASN